MSNISGITEQDIANYLANTPSFFERHAELVASIQLASPHGGRAVSLQERQMEMLREKIRGLESKIIEMIRHGQDNVGLADKLHRWTRAMMLTSGASSLADTLVTQLQHEFLIPQAALRVWDTAAAYTDLPCSRAVSQDVRSFASSLPVPYCGVNSGFEAVQWLAEPASVMSVAMIQLRRTHEDSAFGLLILGSPDPTRYSADMGTDFLARVGELASAALQQLLPPV